LNTLLLFFMANPGAEGGGGGSFLATWGILIPLFLIMYLLLIRPQRKRQKEHQKLLSELKKGDRVVTNSGLFGTIFAIQDDKNKVVLKISDDIKVEFLKSSIAAKVD
jgi:preprotein translocase subunit YajC